MSLLLLQYVSTVADCCSMYLLLHCCSMNLLLQYVCTEIHLSIATNTRWDDALSRMFGSYCNTQQGTATHCNSMLQNMFSASDPYYSTLQYHTATQCNSMLHGLVSLYPKS